MVSSTFRVSANAEIISFQLEAETVTYHAWISVAKTGLGDNHFPYFALTDLMYPCIKSPMLRFGLEKLCDRNIKKFPFCC